MGGKAKAPKIDVPDPFEIIRAETEANRFNTQGPFGSTRWNGSTQVTELSPEMQAMKDRVMGLGMQDSERFEMPSFVNDIAGGIMGNVGDRYGVSKPASPKDMPPPSIQPIGPRMDGQIEGMTPPINSGATSSLADQMAQLRGLIGSSGGNFQNLINTRMR